MGVARQTADADADDADDAAVALGLKWPLPLEDAAFVQAGVFGDISYGAVVAEFKPGCATAAGAAALDAILCSPVRSPRRVRERGECVRRLAEACDGSGVGYARPRPAGEQETRDALWCLTGPADEETEEYLTQAYFHRKPFSVFDSMWPVMWAATGYAIFVAPLLVTLSPLYALVAPYMLLLMRGGDRVPLSVYLEILYHGFMGAHDALGVVFGEGAGALQIASVVSAVLVYVQSVASALQSASVVRDVCTRIASKMSGVSACVRAYRAAVAEVTGTPCPRAQDVFFGRWLGGASAGRRGRHDAADAADAAVDPPFSAALRALPDRRYSTKPTLCSAGNAMALTDYHRLRADGKRRETLRELLRRLACMDALIAVARAVKPLGMCRVSVGGAGLLARTAKRPDAVVPNDFALLPSRGAGVLLITGPNAGGKSSFMRTVATVALLAQTVGHAMAERTSIRPLSYLCAATGGGGDDPAAGLSRFQVELLRAGGCMQEARRDPHADGLVLLDEVFGGSTDAAAGAACAARLLSVLASCPGCAVLAATHSAEVSDIAMALPGARSVCVAVDTGYRVTDGRMRAPPPGRGGGGGGGGAVDMMEATVLEATRICKKPAPRGAD